MKKDELISQIGGLLLVDSEYQQNDWDGFSIVVTLHGGQQRMTGFRYLNDGSFFPSLPDDPADRLFDDAIELRTTMKAETGDEWHQCLIQVWRPGPEIRVLFEYDDPTRWKLKKVSLDMSDYAHSLKPPMD